MASGSVAFYVLGVFVRETIVYLDRRIESWEEGWVKSSQEEVDVCDERHAGNRVEVFSFNEWVLSMEIRTFSTDQSLDARR